MRGVGREAGAVTPVEDRRRAAVMHVGRREIAEAAVVVGVIVPSQEVVADGARVFECAERFGNAGRYLKVRNCASENGLSLLTAGREWLAAMPRSETTARRACCAWARRGRRES